jgi:membrane protease YdiL (CAAX protease family)
MHSLRFPVLGTALAIAVTTTMDANGLSMFSALPLMLLTAVFWGVERLPHRAVGLRWGAPHWHGLALGSIAIVIGSLVAAAWIGNAFGSESANWSNARLNMIAGSTIGIVVVLLTEEGFFRGWLWASLSRRGLSPRETLVLTTLAFTLWHVSAVTLDTGFNPPVRQLPVYFVTATALGAIWGMLRLVSGSVLVASVCHAVWNAFAYALFGFGESGGALGIVRTDVYGPEVGLLGMMLNAAAAVILWRWVVAPRLDAAPAGSDA